MTKLLLYQFKFILFVKSGEEREKKMDYNINNEEKLSDINVTVDQILKLLGNTSPPPLFFLNKVDFWSKLAIKVSN